MENKLNLRSLTQDELMATNGGEITKGSSFAYDVFYTIGLIGRGLYEFVVGAAEFQASLPPNLKK